MENIITTFASKIVETFLKLVLGWINRQILPLSIKKQNGEMTGNYFFDKHFQKGLVFPAKDKRLLVIRRNNAIDDFFLIMPGYCFIHKLLPDDFKFSHIRDRYCVVPNPTGDSAIEKIKELLSTYAPAFWAEIIKQVPKWEQEMTDRNPDINFSWRDLYFKLTGSYFYQDFSFAKEIGFREIEVNKWDNDQIIPIKDPRSPYLFVATFAYAFRITGVKDINQSTTDFTLVYNAYVFNPYIFEVEAAYGFSLLGTRLSSISAEHALKYALHKASPGTNELAKTLADLKNDILTASRSPENYLGLCSESIGIFDIKDMSPGAQELEEENSAMLIANKQQERLDFVADAQNKRARDFATNQVIVLNTLSEGKNNAVKSYLVAYGDGIKAIETEKNATYLQKLKDLRGADVSDFTLIHWAEIIKGLNINDKPQETLIQGLTNVLSIDEVTTLNESLNKNL